MDIVQTIALTMGVGWASGLNLYAALLMLGLLGATGDVHLPQQLSLLSNPIVIIASGIMYFVEFCADKTPGLDTGWDVIHTFIRIPAGAILAMGAVGDVSPPTQFVALLIGGTLSAGTHALKAGSRVLINASPEPFTNWAASVSEDILVVGGLWTALHYPAIYLVALVLFVTLMIVVLPRLWGSVYRFLEKVKSLACGSAKGDAHAPVAIPAFNDKRNT